jgi:glycerophosphoryl diester phosphodiesterase
MRSFLPLTFVAVAVAYPTASQQQQPYLVSLGPRPYYIVNNMTDGPLKQKLQSCENKPVTITDFSIGHRGGGTLQFPEETVQSENAGARMGAGILECDVSFTGDRGLVCRHSLCDLHTTTDILLRPALAKKCTVPFTPANGTAPANALCCTSDITTAECKICPTRSFTKIIADIVAFCR